MGKIAKGVSKIHSTMLYGNYCYIFIENFPQKFSSCSVACYKLIKNGVSFSTKIKLFDFFNLLT